MITLAYWNTRGLCQPIRLMLEYVGAEYEEKPYPTGPAPAFDRSEWHLGDKHKLGLDFPNLPYLVNGETKVSQTHAIMRHLSRRHGLEPKTEKAKQLEDMLACEAMDIHIGFFLTAYNPDFDKLRQAHVDKVGLRFKSLEKFLAEKPYFNGDSVTFPDFHLYEVIVVHERLSPELMAGLPKLMAFARRFEEIPRIKAFLGSTRFAEIKDRINSPMASWGN